MIRTPIDAVRWDGVTVRYGERAALSRVGLSVAPGEFVALVGPNGSGKTTLLRTVLGFVTPDEGSVAIGGDPVEVLSYRERALRVAWVPQQEEARDDVPLLDYVLYGTYARLGPLDGIGAHERSAALRILTEVDLADRAPDGIRSLSGGERQRATLARALVQAAPLLLLDEPTAHLDIGHQLDLLARVRALARTGRATVVAALHDLNLAARFSDRLVVLSRGRKVAEGTATDVLSEELVERVWGIASEVRRDARTGVPYLLPHRVVPAAAPAPAGLGGGPVHVVGGGGSASVVLRALAEEGYRLTAGVLNLLDTDFETAESLGIPTTAEVPFAPIGAEARSRVRQQLGAARVIVVAPVPVGPSNLANLEELRPVASRVVLMARAADREWDFTGGSASGLLAALRSSGAAEVDGLPALLQEVAQRVRPSSAAI